MKNFIYTLILSAVLLPVISCQKSQETQVASRFELKLSNDRKWEAGDEVGIIRVAGDKVERATASPILTGRKESLFMFDWKGYEEGADIVVYYPASAEVNYENGTLSVPVPELQDGSLSNVYLAKGRSNGSSYLDIPMVLESYWHNLQVSVKKGDYSISKAEFRSQEQNVTVGFSPALNCRQGVASFHISLPAVTLEKGYSVTFTTDDDRTFELWKDGRTDLPKGEVSIAQNAGFPQELVVCGDNMIYIIDAELAEREGFEKAVKWEWDASGVASVVGADMQRLDDCKPVDGGTKILATSSRSWAVLLDVATKELLWWSYKSADNATLLKNAHSADLLPEGRIAVACSGDDNGAGDKIQVFDMAQPNKAVCKVSLESAHGVVWNESTQRLYAVGGRTLAVYKLTDWNTATPSLTLENSFDTSDYVTSLHDMTFVNDQTLLLAGRKAVLYNLSNGTFTSLPHFSGSTALKSVNYNPASGDCWYTDATDPENQVDYDWATRTIFHTSDVAGSYVDRQIAVPEGFNMYKVRVKSW